MVEEAPLAEVPYDIMMDIISRLPVKTVINCKCVCKSWLNLLTSPEFVKCHHSKSKPSLVFSCDHTFPSTYHVIELESYNAITVFNLMEFSGYREDTFMIIEGSVNGLMFCRMGLGIPYSYYICNPITREYIELPHPQERPDKSYECCGFGVSKMKGLYKMVRISVDLIKQVHLRCKVYTLGTRSWRTIPFATPDVPPLEYCAYSKGAFLNGNLHWLAKDFEGRCWIFCFDLETELFSIFSAPVGNFKMDLIASVNCLHLLEYGSNSETFVWSMKEYGIDESWTKECVISTIMHLDGQSYTINRLINVFSNGDVLIELFRWCLLYYSSKGKTGRVMCISELLRLDSKYIGMLHSPSFLSLKSLAMEDVKLFQRSTHQK